MSLPAAIVFGYLAVALLVGVVAGRKGRGGVSDFVAGDRAFGPVVMYFVMGATIFSAYALLSTLSFIAFFGFMSGVQHQMEKDSISAGARHRSLNAELETTGRR